MYDQTGRTSEREVVEEAINQELQVITKNGVEVEIVLSYPETRQMIALQNKLSDFFRNSPLAEVDLDLTRKKDNDTVDYDSPNPPSQGGHKN